MIRLLPAHRDIAAVAVNFFLFKQPISVGDVVSFYAEVVKVGRTSITVDVQVFAERHPLFNVKQLVRGAW